MKLLCIGSSSRGNGYILQSSNGALLIECGMPLVEVKKSLGWKLSGISGCVVSHRHKDHSKYLPEYLKFGIRALALEDVFASFPKLNRTFCKSIEPMHGYIVGGFKV